MAAGQPLRGLVGQAMNGRRQKPFTYTAQFPPGTYSFTIPRTGRWLFVGWGAGGGSSGDTLGVASGSGGYGEVSRYLIKGQVVVIVVGINSSGTGGATSVTFPGGSVMTCGGGVGAASGGAGGAATGGDVNLAGSAGGSPGAGTGGGASAGTTPGGGAPANLPFRGGAAGAVTAGGTAPAAGAGATGSGNSASGGSGLSLAIFLRA